MTESDLTQLPLHAVDKNFKIEVKHHSPDANSPSESGKKNTARNGGVIVASIRNKTLARNGSDMMGRASSEMPLEVS